MPTIWLCGGFGWLAALPGSKFKVRGSTFDVRRSASAPCGLNVIYGAYPAHVRRDSHESPRQQARRYGGSREAVRCGSGGGPMWIAQDSDSTPLTTLTFWLWASLSVTIHYHNRWTQINTDRDSSKPRFYQAGIRSPNSDPRQGKARPEFGPLNLCSSVSICGSLLHGYGLSAPCEDGATPAQARRIPHVDCANHWC